MDSRIDIQLLETPLSITNCYHHVLDESCGGVNAFIGTVRKWNNEKEVTHLDFEAYKPMALTEMTKIAQQAIDKFGLEKAAVHHRLGKVGLKEIAVIIVVSAKHRKPSFQACEFIIDELKKHVPIWKKEYLTDGSHWVNSRP